MEERRMQKFEELREKYPEFWYNRYEIWEGETEIELEFEFEIPGLVQFHPKLKIPKKSLPYRAVGGDFVRNLAFQIGMVELVSYYKATMAPKIVVKCGHLDAWQIEWWKKLYYLGLGELRFVNGIEIGERELVEIECEGERIDADAPEGEARGYLIPIGGGKDSIVTLETLKVDPDRDLALIINPKPVTRECAELAGLDDAHVAEVWRTIDPELMRLNCEGMINGHTPFSAMLAFVSYLVAYLLGKEYVVVSNESSANESNVCGCAVNHQYSKSFEFERDFRQYATRYLRGSVQYLSFLRPLNELQIAKIFARLEKYHSVFRSCNVGSKGETWEWCGHCAKCLFAFVILSPYLYPEKLVKIFGKDLYEDESLWSTLQELAGKAKVKPFDCVGTFEEVNVALAMTIRNLRETSQQLPRLLEQYEKAYGLVPEEDLTERYNHENALNAEQEKLLREAVLRDR